MLLSDSCTPQRAKHVSLCGPTAPLVWELLHLPASDYGAIKKLLNHPAHPRLWDSLPSHLRDVDLAYSWFQRSLKTFLFGHWGHGAVWTILTSPSRNNLTYLQMPVVTYRPGNHFLCSNECIKWLACLRNCWQQVWQTVVGSRVRRLCTTLRQRTRAKSVSAREILSS